MARKKTLDEHQLTDTNYYILLTLTKPTHGYNIMKKVKEISEETFEIGPASLYTSLKKLQNADIIQLLENQHDNKKIYELTSKGKDLLLKDYKRRKQMVLQAKGILESE